MTAHPRSPFFYEGPALVSFSGGRTSGLMLWSILEEGLGKDVHVVFANTGKERPETLNFVKECGDRWGVSIRWLEFRLRELDCNCSVEAEEGWGNHSPGCACFKHEATFEEVTYETASRNGEPFEALIGWRNFLPNPVTRFCTQELKIRVMKMFARSLGLEHWINVVGMRADEPHRVAKLAAANAAGKERWVNDWPLARVGATKADVERFWGAQPFDLRLKSWEGNCDLCFQKGLDKQARIFRARPEAADWWIRMEKKIGATFRKDQVTVEQLRHRALTQPLLPLFETESVDCGCTD